MVRTRKAVLNLRLWGPPSASTESSSEHNTYLRDDILGTDEQDKGCGDRIVSIEQEKNGGWLAELGPNECGFVAEGEDVVIVQQD